MESSAGGLFVHNLSGSGGAAAFFLSPTLVIALRSSNKGVGRAVSVFRWPRGVYLSRMKFSAQFLHDTEW